MSFGVMCFAQALTQLCFEKLKIKIYAEVGGER